MPEIETLAAYPLAPSEIVLLNGEAFAPAAGLMDKITLLHTAAAVSASALARAILAAALLAAEQGGALRLEARAKPTPFGPSKVRTLYANPGEPGPAWPAYSLEARLQLPAAAPLEVSAVVQGLLEADAPNPWHHAVEGVQRGLAQRGLLETVEVVQFGFVKARAYQLPKTTRALAAHSPVEAVRGLLNACESGRPEVWAQLGQQIDAGLRARLKPGAPAPVRKTEDDE